MIPSDLIQRLVSAHNNAVKAAQRLSASQPGTTPHKKLSAIYENSEKKFDAAMCAVVDEAASE